MQGISRAGKCKGLADMRSALIGEVWRIWDEREALGKPMRLANNHYDLILLYSWTCKQTYPYNLVYQTCEQTHHHQKLFIRLTNKHINLVPVVFKQTHLSCSFLNLCDPSLMPRKFLWLENVSHIITPKHREMLTYLAED